MKERELKLAIPENETLVTLPEEVQNKIFESITEIIFAAGYLKQLITEKELSVCMSETLQSLLESYLIDLHKNMGYESVLAREKEERYRDIRSANIENRMLRQQLGDKVSAEDVRESLKNILEKLNTFWDTEGWGYVRNITFHPHGVSVEFSTGGFSLGYSKSEETQQKQKLQDFGFMLIEEEKGRRDSLEFSKENLAVFKSLLDKFFTDYTIGEIKTRSKKSDSFIIGIEVFIRDYNELLNLPYPTYSEKEQMKEGQK